jgi:hypothetical protein
MSIKVKLALLLSTLVVSAVIAVSASSETADEEENSLARDLTVSQKPIFDVGLSGIAKKIEVDAWVDNNTLTYGIGETLRISVRPREEAYLTVLNVGSSGRTAVLFPNHFQRESLVRAGQIVHIPDYNAGWKIDVAGPTGVEVIKVIASKQPLKLAELQKLAAASPEHPLLTLDRTAEDVGRDLVVQFDKPEGGKPPAFGVRNILVRVVDKVLSPSDISVSDDYSPQSSLFGLQIRSGKLVYKIGETVRFGVTAEKDCRLTVTSIGTSGHALQIFPNKIQSDNVLHAGQLISIPSPHLPFQLQARGPAGVEGVVAECRGLTAPFGKSLDSQDGFAEAGDFDVVGRDLVAVPAQGGAAQIERAFSGYIVVK